MPCVHDDEQKGHSSRTSCHSNQQELRHSKVLVRVHSKVPELEPELARSKEQVLARNTMAHRCNGCADGCEDESKDLLAWFRHSRKELARSKELELARSRMLLRCNDGAGSHADEQANQLASTHRSTMVQDRSKLEQVLARSRPELDCSNRSCD